MEHPFHYHEFTATTLSGLEEVCAAELVSMGAENVQPLRRAVTFTGDRKLMYRANYESRTALRILKPLATIEAPDASAYYVSLLKMPWEEIFDLSNTFSIEAVGSHPAFSNTLFAVQRCKDAIADRFRKLTGQRPSVSTDDADINIHVFLMQDRALISLDSSGIPLFKRGYRKASAEAPLNEVLAAGLIMLTGWDAKTDFFDPFCGSGTIPIEAALMATSTPPGIFRKKHGFERWKDFDPALLKEVKAAADSGITKATCPITASDKDPRALNITRRNIESAGMKGMVSTQLSAFEDFDFPAGPGLIVGNPPYGERLRPFDLVAMYKGFGDKLKRDCAGYEAWIIGSDAQALKFIGLKPSKKYTVFNGPLECRFCQYRLFSGSRRDHLSGEK